MENNFLFKKFKTTDSDLYNQTINLRNDILRKPLGKQYLQHDLLIEKNNQFYGILLSQKLIATLSTYELGKSTIKIVSFAVDSDFQKQGIGSLLLKQVIVDYQKSGYDEVNLTARASAHEFYLKNGFHDISGPFKNDYLNITDYDMQFFMR
ncbi:GNAT family N-acetyltransferase [Leuconostoc sp. MS02]|uniref:GNAT family N-acetyltransferase n=1 Tax=Leuconostoc aquikimchii TaxID=3236804 RepID=A0ABV3S2Q7_9LACO